MQSNGWSCGTTPILTFRASHLILICSDRLIRNTMAGTLQKGECFYNWVAGWGVGNIAWGFQCNLMFKPVLYTAPGAISNLKIVAFHFVIWLTYVDHHCQYLRHIQSPTVWMLTQGIEEQNNDLSTITLRCTDRQCRTDTDTPLNSSVWWLWVRRRRGVILLSTGNIVKMTSVENSRNLFR